MLIEVTIVYYIIFNTMLSQYISALTFLTSKVTGIDNTPTQTVSEHQPVDLLPFAQKILNHCHYKTGVLNTVNKNEITDYSHVNIAGIYCGTKL